MHTEDSLFAPKGRLLVVDLMPILYRGYFVFMSRPRRTISGINTSSLFLLASTIDQLIREWKPTHMAIAMESKTKTFRHKMYPAYKGQREKMPEDIGTAIEQSVELAAAWGIPTISHDGYEADDILGTLAARGAKDGFNVLIASPDKDLGQLAGPTIDIIKPGEKKSTTAKDICEQWGIPAPHCMLDYLALAGDASDNIPGLPGVGPKTAQKLLAEYATVDNLIAHAADVKGKIGNTLREHIEDLRLSQKLVTIVKDIPLTQTWDDLKLMPPDPEKLGAVLAKYELNQIASRLSLRRAPKDGETDDLFAAASTNTKKSAADPSGTAFATLKTFPHTYTLVTDAAGREALAAELAKAPLIAFDTETTGPHPRHDRIVGCSFATMPGKAWYVALPEDRKAAIAALESFRTVFEDPAVEKVGHNIKFDRTILLRLGFTIEGTVHDTMLAHYLLDAPSRHDMNHVANAILNYAPLPIDSLIGKDKATNMGELPPEMILDYAAEDADVTLRLWLVLKPKIDAEGLTHLLCDCEEPLSGVLTEMENEGIFMDPAGLRDFRREIESEILKLELDIRDVAGAGINLGSPKQVGELLFGELKIDPKAKRSARGQFSTNEETLLKVRDRHPIVDKILDWRACVKLKNTYIDKLPTHIDPEDGRVHTTFNQSFTETGRLSSSDPNLQNIPVRTDRGQRIRAAFVRKAEDWSVLSADYSQVELRLMAAVSGDERMIAAFRAGEDIHAQTAAVVYGIPLSEVTPQQRSYCKMVNFGIIYGISAFGLASRLRIPRREAQELIDTYFAQYPAIRTYMDKTINDAREKGYAVTLFGRRRPLPDLTSRNSTTRNSAERIAINMPIQGTAADIIKFAMVAIAKELKQRHLRTRMILQIHDELLFDVPNDELEEVKTLVRDTMEHIIDLPVPLSVSVGVGPTWLAAH